MTCTYANITASLSIFDKPVDEGLIYYHDMIRHTPRTFSRVF